MTRFLRIGAGAVLLVMAALAVMIRPTSGWADSPLCKPTGCPSGSQLCATVSAGVPGVGSVTYYCYQAAPGGTPPKT